MPKRLKVLLSAYACEPHRGSEPEVGWQWAIQMARYHDVTVLTRASNRKGIEKELEMLRGTQPLPHFIYHDEGPFLLWFKERFDAIRTYYMFWQISAWKIVSRLNKESRFDLLHHVTFAGFRFRTAIWGHGVPCVWGPVGGIQSIPWRLLPWKYPSPLMLEVFRHFNNFVQSAPFHFLPKRAQMTTITLVSTPEMEQTFLNLGLETTLMPTIGLDVRNIPFKPHASHEGPLKVLFVGSVITLKGIDLAIQAMAEVGTDAEFTIVGDGKFMAVAKELVKYLGIESRVEFLGRLPLKEALKVYANYDLFLFPSLHDTGGYAVIEAMCNGLPAVCLECGGPRLAVRDGAGVLIPMGRRRDVVSALAAAVRKFDRNRPLLAEHGQRAREVILREYDWDKKGRRLDAIYQQAVTEGNGPRGTGEMAQGLKGIFNRLFPIKGMAISAAILFIIGTLGFLSMNVLKNNAKLIVEDTMPGLSGAGTANSTLAEGFNRTLLVLMAETPEDRTAYRKELDTFGEQTSQSLTGYERARFTPVELNLYNQVLDRREKYLIARQHVLDLVDHQQRTEALQACNNSMLPAYLEYKTEAEKLLKFNTHQGSSRGETILKVCTITQFAVAGIGVMLFVAGFAIGLFK